MRAVVYASAVAELARSREVLDHLTASARTLRTIVLASNVPVRTGTYRSSFKVRRARASTRAAQLIADDRKAVWLEYGTGDPEPTPHFDVLTKAVKAARFHRVVFVAHARRGSAK